MQKSVWVFSIILLLALAVIVIAQEDTTKRGGEETAKTSFECLDSPDKACCEKYDEIDSKECDCLINPEKCEEDNQLKKFVEGSGGESSKLVKGTTQLVVEKAKSEIRKAQLKKMVVRTPTATAAIRGLGLVSPSQPIGDIVTGQKEEPEKI